MDFISTVRNCGRSELRSEKLEHGKDCEELEYSKDCKKANTARTVKSLMLGKACAEVRAYY